MTGTCLITRFRGQIRKTVYPRIEYNKEIDGCWTPWSHIIVLIEILIGMLPCPNDCIDESVAVERYWFHQWREEPGSERCYGDATYFMSHEVLNNNKWQLHHVESGYQYTPDFGPYLQEALESYCHNLNNEFEVCMYDYIDGMLQLSDPDVLKELSIPAAGQGVQWDGGMLVCKDGSQLISTIPPCCDDGGEEPPEEPADPPPLADNLPPGVSVRDDVPKPPGVVPAPGLGYFAEDEHIPCSWLQYKCICVEWGRGINYPSSCEWEVANNSCSGSTGMCINPWEDILFDERETIIFTACDFPAYEWTVKKRLSACYPDGFARYTGEIHSNWVFVYAPQYSVGMPHRWNINECSGTGDCVKWILQINLETNGLPPYPKGLVIRNYIEVQGSDRPTVRYEDMIPYVYSGDVQLGPIGFAASTYRWFRFSAGPAICVQRA